MCPFRSHLFRKFKDGGELETALKGTVPAVNKFVYYTFLWNYA